ncbi:MAG: glycosyltransferase family 2 protein [Actinomycetota bacterium]
MKKDDDPLLSIITVNYNGKHYLPGLFKSIRELNYPSSKIQAIMVDNNSQDGSVEFVHKNFPEVNIVKLDENQGYAGGNNAGFKAAEGKYIALINNDCEVGKNWIVEMLDIFRQAPGTSRIGAVGSKVLFYYPYLPLEFLSDSINKRQNRRPSSFRRLGVRVSDVKIIGAGNSVNKSIKYLEGFYPRQTGKENKAFYWTNGSGYLTLPIEDQDKDMEVELELFSHIVPNKLKVIIGGELLEEFELAAGSRKVRLSVSKSYYQHKKDIINSCGTKINRSFYSMDRGYLSFDEGQYARAEEVFSLSGSSFMVSREMLEDVGYFDQKFFTYYEDIDLFWRARLKGWKHFFTPSSVARHHHCGTGAEWSYSFTYYVLRNRLLMIFKCGWPALFFKSYVAFVASMIFNTCYFLVNLAAGRKLERVDIPIRIKLFLKFFYLLPQYLAERIRIRSSANIKDREIKGWTKNF